MKTRIIRWFLEDVPIIKWLNGNKTTISRAAMFSSAVLWALQVYFPEYAPIPASEYDAKLAMILSYLGIEIGTIHKEAKANDRL